MGRDVALRSRVMLCALASCKLLIQFAGINHYGFFRDELYYMACGEHLAWGYVDQPPLVAFVAWLARHTLGTSLFATRLLPVLAGAAVVYATGRIAAELGGGLFAQFLAAVSILFAPAYIAFDSFLSMNAFEPLFWLLCAWIAIRIVKGASPRLWLLFGVDCRAGPGKQAQHAGIWVCAGCRAAAFGAGAAVSFEMDLDWRGDRAGDLSAEFDLGGAQRLAANRGGPQRAAIQERSDLLLCNFCSSRFFSCSL